MAKERIVMEPKKAKEEGVDGMEDKEVEEAKLCRNFF